MINKQLQDFLRRYSDYIKTEQWDALYTATAAEEWVSGQMLSEILLQIDPNIPQKLDRIISSSFDGLDISGSVLKLNSRDIEWRAFSFAHLPSQVILDHVDQVDYGAFYYSYFDYLTIEGSTKCADKVFAASKIRGADLRSWSTEAIPNRFFSDCTNLATVKFPDNLKEIGTYAFSNCSALTDIEIPRQLTKIKLGAFDRCWLQSVATPKTIEELAEVQGILNLTGFCSETTNIKCLDGCILAQELDRVVALRELK